jgi:hypothetical protein
MDRFCGLVVKVPGYKSRVRFPAQPDFLRSSGSGTGFTQPREYNWRATWKERRSPKGTEQQVSLFSQNKSFRFGLKTIIGHFFTRIFVSGEIYFMEIIRLSRTRWL